MSTILLVVGILVATLAMIVLTALLRGAVSYLNVRWHALKSNRRKQRPTIRNQIVGP
jgi:nucleoside-specific outer membrane channel protein Tsx